MNGMDVLARHVPELTSLGGRFRIALYAGFCIVFVTLYFILTDNIPTWSIDSQIIILALGFLAMSFFFSRKKLYQEKYKDLAYRNAFAHYAIPGIALIIAAIGHAAYMNGPVLPHGWWTYAFVIAGWFFLVTGAILWIRAAFVFGADNLALLYVYYPDEGRIIESSIYRLLRHPIYAGVMRVMIGLAFINGNANAVAFTIFLPLGLTGWLRLVEERELIERFGRAYIDYRKRVPAFWLKLSDVGRYLSFLITGK